MPTSLSADILVSPQDIYSQVSNTSSTVPYITQTPLLGSRAVTGDGREFRWVQAGGTALVVGKLQQSPAEITNHQNLATTGASSGATSITVTLGNTAATANQYINGFLVIASDSGGTPGQMYRIASNPAASGSASLTLTLADALRVTVSSSATIDLYPNPYMGVIVNPAAASSAPVGGAVYPITASYYGWIQSKGAAVLLADGSVTVGTQVVASNGTAGAVEALTGVQAIVGTALTGIATTEYGLVNLELV